MLSNLFFCSHPKTHENERSSLISTHSHNTRHFSTKGKLKCDALSSHDTRSGTAVEQCSTAARPAELGAPIMGKMAEWPFKGDSRRLSPFHQRAMVVWSEDGTRTARMREHRPHVLVEATRTRAGLKDLTFLGNLNFWMDAQPRLT